MNTIYSFSFSFADSVIKFYGYFYLENETLPVERILIIAYNAYHVEIYEKETEEDNRKCYNDDDGGDDESENIIFFPSNTITLKYRVLRELITAEDYREAVKRIQSLEDDVEKRNTIFYEKRMKKEKEEFDEECKKMDYKSFFAKFKETTSTNKSPT
jgi:hypothetical protein